MTIKALVYGGVQITGITPPKAASQFDGVWLEFRGSTFQEGQWKQAGMTIEMNQKDALDLALSLILAAEKQGIESSKAVPKLIARLNKRTGNKK